MLRAIRRLFTTEESKDDWRVRSAALSHDKAVLRAKLIAVAIARTTNYADLAH